MERGIDLIIWAVLFLLLFGGSLIKALLRWRAEQREEAKKPVPERKRHTFLEELKKTLEEMAVEEAPEIVIEETEAPHRRRARRRRMMEEPPPAAPPRPQEPAVSEKKIKLSPVVEDKRAEARHRKIPLSEILPRDELQKAVVLSEILGPPRSRRRSHRFF